MGVQDPKPILNVFSVDEMQNKYCAAFDINYIKQCKYGEKIEFFRQDTEDGTIVEGRVDNEVRVRAKIVLKNV